MGGPGTYLKCIYRNKTEICSTEEKLCLVAMTVHAIFQNVDRTNQIAEFINHVTKMVTTVNNGNFQAL